MPHILVATDLSPRADRALARAFRLARNHGASLTALNVIDSDLPDKLTAPLVEDAQKHLEEFCASQDAANEVDWSVKTVTGDPSSDIHVAAVQTKADLIVLGLHRRRALFDALRETTLERLVRTATRPVLLVAAPADHDYKQAVAAVDASPAASAALTAARQWAPGAEIHAFHAVYTGLGGSMARDPEHIMGEALVRDTEHQIRVWASSGGLPAGCRGTRGDRRRPERRLCRRTDKTVCRPRCPRGACAARAGASRAWGLCTGPRPGPADRPLDRKTCVSFRPPPAQTPRAGPATR